MAKQSGKTQKKTSFYGTLPADRHSEQPPSPTDKMLTQSGLDEDQLAKLSDDLCQPFEAPHHTKPL